MDKAERAQLKKWCQQAESVGKHLHGRDANGLRLYFRPSTCTSSSWWPLQPRLLFSQHHAFFSSLQRSRVKQLYEFGVSIRSFGAGAADTSVSPATTRSRAGVSIGAPRQRVARRTRAAGEPSTPWGTNKRPKLSARVVSKRPGNGWRSSGGRVYFGGPWFRVAARSAVMGRRGPTQAECNPFGRRGWLCGRKRRMLPSAAARMSS